MPDKRFPNWMILTAGRGWSDLAAIFPPNSLLHIHSYAVLKTRLQWKCMLYGICEGLTPCWWWSRVPSFQPWNEGVAKVRFTVPRHKAKLPLDEASLEHNLLHILKERVLCWCMAANANDLRKHHQNHSGCLNAFSSLPYCKHITKTSSFPLMPNSLPWGVTSIKTLLFLFHQLIYL